MYYIMLPCSPRPNAAMASAGAICIYMEKSPIITHSKKMFVRFQSAATSTILGRSTCDLDVAHLQYVVDMYIKY